ncbi:MAG: hypothetical protein HYY06_15305 [Deltaproteobacteria bacterium]|nr:hypothetical protein [Deltaproteobacteria bacterium]
MHFQRLLVAFAVVSAFGSTAGAAPGELSPREERRLERGRIVRRPLRGPRRGLVGGSSWILVRAPVAEVWRTLGRVEAYRLMFPKVDRIQVLEEEGPRRLVRVDNELAVGTLSAFVALHFDAREREIRFRLDRGRDNPVRDGWGFLRMDAWPGREARTLLSFGVAVDPGGDELARGLLEGRGERRMLNVTRLIKRFMEERSRPAHPRPTPSLRHPRPVLSRPGPRGLLR